jgi:hypothetical protein
MYCPKCGKENADHFKFCLGCGADLAEARREAATAAPKMPESGAELIKQMASARSVSELSALALQLGDAASRMGLKPWTGGDLPLTAQPSPAPRPLPAHFTRDQVSPTTKFLLPFGAGFGGIGLLVAGSMVAAWASSGDAGLLGMGALFGVIFGGVGAVCFGIGWRKLSRSRHIWREGHVVVGNVQGMSRDMNTRINGQHPMILRYTYALDGVTHSGEHSSLQRALHDHAIGQPVHVLYDPQHPERSVLFFNQPRREDAGEGGGAW